MKNAHFFQNRKGFTLVELLVATSLVVLLLIFLVATTDSTAKTWKYASSKTEQFQEARAAFDTMTRRLSEATLNTYWDVEYRRTTLPGSPPITVDMPNRYVRQSELRFMSGPMNSLVSAKTNTITHGVFFQAPAGFVEAPAKPGDPDNKPLTNVLNTSGFFLEITDNDRSLPSFLQGVVPDRRRSRLMEFNEPSEKLSVYQHPASRDWFTNSLLATDPPVRRLADNVVALILVPKLTPQDELARIGKDPLTKDYIYDSTQTNRDPDINPKNQLPPVLQVTMVAIDELSASRLADRFKSSPPSSLGGLGVGGLDVNSFFKDPTKLEDQAEGTASARAGELTKFQAKLDGTVSPGDLKLTYRVFTTNVSIRGAKWSRAQSDSIP